jgi:23S rRNA-/tRNA-specific pseudouridylate synthase
MSRNFIQHLIEKKQITINTLYPKKSQILQKGDEIVIEEKFEKSDASILQYAPISHLTVLAQYDDHAIVIKPR